MTPLNCSLKITSIFAIVLTGIFSSCGKKKQGSQFGAPNLGTIVDAAAPSNLKTTSLLFNSELNLNREDRASCSVLNNDSSGCSTATSFMNFVRSEVFQKISGVAATMYYRYWVDVVDTAISQTNTRLAGIEDSAACLGQTPATVNFTFPMQGTTVSVSTRLQCWEAQSGSGAATQNMAFGKDENYYYLVYRTNDNATTSGSGVRIVIAKATLDGNSTDIWFLGASYQTYGGTTSRRVNAQRVLANKTTGAFTFNSIEEDDVAKNYLFGNFFVNSDATHLYVEASFGNGGTITDVTGMTRTNPYCASVSDLTTAVSASNCNSIDADSLPSNFGLTTPMTNSSTGSATLWLSSTTEEASFLTAVDTIMSKSYTDDGVGSF